MRWLRHLSTPVCPQLQPEAMEVEESPKVAQGEAVTLRVRGPGSRGTGYLDLQGVEDRSLLGLSMHTGTIMRKVRPAKGQACLPDLLDLHAASLGCIGCNLVEPAFNYRTDHWISFRCNNVLPGPRHHPARRAPPRAGRAADAGGLP
jgi:hypothetical protein